MHYLSFTAFTGNYGADQDRLGKAGFLHGGDLVVDDDGRFEILVGPERRGDNWLPTSPEPTLVAVRQFFLDRDREVQISVQIEIFRHGSYDLDEGEALLIEFTRSAGDHGRLLTEPALI